MTIQRKLKRNALVYRKRKKYQNTLLIKWKESEVAAVNYE